jgi:hypothetical protein
MTAFVFVGPSLGRDLPPPDPAITILPPAARGDVYRAVRHHPRIIGLIDGYFDGVPAVAHKEILFALQAGIHVLGAASMGALRAAELQIYGMRPVGTIAAAYADGTIEADDEVAVLHGPAETGWLPLSEPLVNIRATLAAATAAGVLDPPAAASLISKASSLFYKERRWETLLGTADLPTFRDWLPKGRVDLKRQDALALLAEVRTLLAADAQPSPVDFDLPPTQAWHDLMAEVDTPPATPDLLAKILVSELRLDPPAYRRYRAEALASLLAPDVAEPAAARAWIERFRLEAGLLRRTDLERWLADRGLDHVWLEHQAAIEAGLASLAATERFALDQAILDRLRLAPDYGERLARARRIQGLLTARGDSSVAIPELAVTPEAAEALDFANADELYQALLARHLYTNDKT